MFHTEYNHGTSVVSAKMLLFYTRIAIWQWGVRVWEFVTPGGTVLERQFSSQLCCILLL